MNEPVYNYVKGKGWVIETFETYMFMMNGQAVRLEARPPELGERYSYTDKGNPDWTHGGAYGGPNLSRFALHYKNYSLTDLNQFSYATDPERYVYVTFVPVDL